MWMAAGFAMLEAGLVRSKNTTEILTKNICLYAIACTMFLIVGYNIMYVDNGALTKTLVFTDGLNFEQALDICEYFQGRIQHRRGSRPFKGKTRYFYEMPFEERYIWGITAGIIRGLYERVYG